MVMTNIFGEFFHFHLVPAVLVLETAVSVLETAVSMTVKETAVLVTVLEATWTAVSVMGTARRSIQTGLKKPASLTNRWGNLLSVTVSQTRAF